MKSYSHTLLASLAALAVLGLAGCAAQPPPPLASPLPAQWRHQLAPLPASEQLQTWWQGFEDPTLDGLVRTALRDTLDLAGAVERLQAARVIRQHASARYLPYVRAKTEDVINPNASASYLVAGFDAVWELGLFGRREGTRRLTQGALDEAGASLAGARVSLVGEVVGDYLMAAAMQDRLRILHEQEGVLRRQGELIRVRVQLGLATAQQLTEAQGQLARLAADRVQAEQQQDALEQQLAVLLARAQPDPAWQSGNGLPPRLPPLPASAPADLLRVRPEIRRAEADVLQAAGAAAVAQADRLPNLAIGGSLVLATNITRNRRAQEYNIASIGPLLDIPLLDWGLRRANADAKAHLLKAATLAYRQAVLTAYAEVETALGNLASFQLRENSEADVSRAAHELARQTDTRMGFSLASALEQASARSTALQSDLVQVDFRVQHALAYVTLFKALGGAALPGDTGATP